MSEKLESLEALKVLLEAASATINKVYWVADFQKKTLEKFYFDIKLTPNNEEATEFVLSVTCKNTGAESKKIMTDQELLEIFSDLRNNGYSLNNYIKFYKQVHQLINNLLAGNSQEQSAVILNAFFADAFFIIHTNNTPALICKNAALRGSQRRIMICDSFFIPDEDSEIKDNLNFFFFLFNDNELQQTKKLYTPYEKFEEVLRPTSQSQDLYKLAVYNAKYNKTLNFVCSYNNNIFTVIKTDFKEQNEILNNANKYKSLKELFQALDVKSQEKTFSDFSALLID